MLKKLGYGLVAIAAAGAAGWWAIGPDWRGLISNMPTDNSVLFWRGIFGQAIFIDPARDLVIASNGNWTTALGYRDGENPARTAFHRAVQTALDREAGRTG